MRGTATSKRYFIASRSYVFLLLWILRDDFTIARYPRGTTITTPLISQRPVKTRIRISLSDYQNSFFSFFFLSSFLGQPVFTREFISRNASRARKRKRARLKRIRVSATRNHRNYEHSPLVEKRHLLAIFGRNYKKVISLLRGKIFQDAVNVFFNKFSWILGFSCTINLCRFAVVVPRRL